MALCPTRAASVNTEVISWRQVGRVSRDNRVAILRNTFSVGYFQKILENQKLKYLIIWFNIFSLILSWSLAKGVPRTIITFCGFVLIGFWWRHLSSHSSKMTSFRVLLKTIGGFCDMVEWPMTSGVTSGRSQVTPVSRESNNLRKYISFSILECHDIYRKKCSIYSRKEKRVPTSPSLRDRSRTQFPAIWIGGL